MFTTAHIAKIAMYAPPDLVKTGNLDEAADAAAIEGIITSRPGDLAEGGTATLAAKAIELLQNIHRVEQKITNWF